MRLVPVLLLSAVALFVSGREALAVSVSGTIASNTTWYQAQSPYVVTGTITVNAGVTLTIEPGVTVKFASIQGIYCYGTLTAVGTLANPIVFTSNQATPTPGYWYGLWFGPLAGASRLEYATVAYAGAFSAGNLFVDNSSPTFDHVTSSYSSGAGFRIKSSGATPTIIWSTANNNSGYGLTLETGGGVDVRDTAFLNNSSYGISTDANTRLLGLSGLTLTGNSGGAGNAVYYRGGTITASETWRSGVDWHVSSTPNVGSTSNSTAALTIQAGATVKFASGQGIYCYGTLTAIGTSASPIVFTSAQATPTAGYWYGLWLGPQAGASRLEHATVSYGGYYAASNVIVDNSSPAFEQVTVRHSSGVGFRVKSSNATPTITGSTVNNNAGYGLTLETGAGADLSDSAFLNNTGYALSAEANTRLLGLTGLTLTGNSSGAGNAVYYRGGTITGNEIWRPGVDWYVSSTPSVGTTSNSSPSLTIQPGVTARFGSVQGIYAYGTLTAIGTAASPILLTSAQATPTPGHWYGLWFGPQAGASRLAYATVSYAGASNSLGNLFVAGSSPVFDHVASTHSSDHGLRVTSGSPVIKNSTFLANGSGGVYNDVPSSPIDASLNYWDSTSGPSGTGGGSGQSISTGVTFQPWLLAPSAGAHYFANAAVQNSTFDPTADIDFLTDFSTSLSGAWSASIRDATGSLVRTIAGSGSVGSIAWDGRDDAGVPLLQGNYTCDFDSTAGSSEVATTARALAFLDAHQNLTISGAGVSQPFFSPNGDSVKDVTVFSGNFNVATANWEVSVKDAADTTVRVVSGVGPVFAFAWDGRNDAAIVQPDGPYSLHVLAIADLASASSSAATVLDNTLPTTEISSPQAAQVLSNVLQNGNAVVSIIGTANDTNFLLWNLEYGSGAVPTYWTALGSWGTVVVAAPFGSLSTLPLSNGEYAVRLRTSDRAGNVNAATRTITIGNFKATRNVLELNAPAGGAVAYTSTVPFALNQTLFVKNLAGSVVRTLFDGARASGSYVDSWNGRTESGALLPDGPYFYFATLTAGASTMTWDLSNDYPFFNDIAAYPSVQTYDPFNNQPMTFSYNFPFAAPVSIALSPLPGQGHIPPNCNAPTHCIQFELYQESGPHTVTWAGVDSSGAYRGDMRSFTVTAERSSFANNAVVVFGTKPALGNVRVTPPVFGPAVGQQQVSFDTSTYQGQSIDVDVTILNQESLSTLRTLHLEHQVPGHIVIPWDGRADNGMWVAPGRYTVTVTVTDPIGNQVTGQILTTIQY